MVRLFDGTFVTGTVLSRSGSPLVAAGAFGWSAVLQPIAGIMPAQLAPATDIRTAVFALAGLIAIKWMVALGMAAIAR